jgi:hypothetical protein
VNTKSVTDKAGKSKRKSISPSIRQQVLIESGYKCGRPVCRNIITLDLHHLIYISNNSRNDASNLLPLCGYCHDMHHAKQLSAEALRFWKGLLLALNQAFDQKSMDLLLYLTKQFDGTTYSGDGVLQFAGLIAGPNGAGKTTFANEFLPNEAICLNFVNADLIAHGLAVFQQVHQFAKHSGKVRPVDLIYDLTLQYVTS